MIQKVNRNVVLYEKMAEIGILITLVILIMILSLKHKNTHFFGDYPSRVFLLVKKY
jgi:hypothetical protein